MNTNWPESIVATLETRCVGPVMEQRVFAERVPDYCLIAETVVTHASPGVLELIGNPDDGYNKIALHCANGEALYSADYKPPYSEEHAGWGIYECRLLSWEPKAWESWST